MTIKINWDFGSYIFEKDGVQLHTGPTPDVALSLIKHNNVRHFDYGQGIVDAPDVLDRFIAYAMQMGVEI